MRLTVQELLAAARRRKNYDDLMLELSGFTAGRIPRFLRREQIERIREVSGLAPSTETPGERAWRRYFELTDPLIRQLAHINHAIGRALERSALRVQAAQEALESIRARAMVDAKGRRVYRTQDRHRGFADDGEELTRQEIDSIHWTPDAPSWEQRQAAGQRLKDAMDEHETILRTKDRADYYAQRMQSGDKLSEDELDCIRKDLDAMPPSVRAEMDGGHFRKASKKTDTGGQGCAEAFTLSMGDIANIRRAKAETPSARRPDFTPKF